MKRKLAQSHNEPGPDTRVKLHTLYIIGEPGFAIRPRWVIYSPLLAKDPSYKMHGALFIKYHLRFENNLSENVLNQDATW